MFWLLQASQIVIQIDGAARGNPGPAAAGIVIQDDAQGRTVRIGRYLGLRTNNQAEYEALVIALQEVARRLQPGFSGGITVRTDSQLLCRQMTGHYRTRNPELARLALKAHALMARLPKVELRHVSRTENRAADRLANLALNRHSRMQRAAAGGELALRRDAGSQNPSTDYTDYTEENKGTADSRR